MWKALINSIFNPFGGSLPFDPQKSGVFTKSCSTLVKGRVCGHLQGDGVGQGGRKRSFLKKKKSTMISQNGGQSVIQTICTVRPEHIQTMWEVPSVSGCAQDTSTDFIPTTHGLFPRQVSRKKALKRCEETGAEYFEGSAKEDVDMDRPFLRAAELGLQEVNGIKDGDGFCLTCLFFIFLMIKDTLLPTVQKTHIGKYRTFPDNLRTAERNSSQHLRVLRGGTRPGVGGFRPRHCWWWPI